MTVSEASARRLARNLADLEKRIKAMERSAQIGYSSIEDGALEVNDADGETVQSIGLQPDGTIGVVSHVAAAPSPPNDPALAAGIESYAVSWDGGYAADHPDGVTVAKVAVHASQETGFEPDATTETASLPLAGGTLIVPGDTEVPTYVRLVAVSAAGVESVPTAEVEVTPQRAPDAVTSDGVPPAASPLPEVTGGVGFIVARLPTVENADPTQVRLYVGAAPGVDTSGDPIATTVNGGALLIRSLANGTPLVAGDTYYVKTVAFDADGDAPESGEASGTVTVVDFDDVSQTIKDDIAAADQKAVAAQGDADQAIADALAASNEAAAAQNTADAKGKVLIQSTAPDAADELPQNLWIDTTAGANTPKQWNGSTWEAVTDKVAVDAAAAAVAAQDAADAADAAATGAQETADGKNTVSYGPLAPSSTTDRVDGDIHYVRSGTAIVGQWRLISGTWEEEQVDGAVLANIDAGSITTGFLDVETLIQAEAITAALLAAESITTEKLAAGVFTAITAMIDELIADEVKAGFILAGAINVGGITIDPEGGITIPQPDGQSISFPADGSPSKIAGEVFAYALTIDGHLTLRGTSNEISPGGVLTLSNGVSPPSIAPTLKWAWNSHSTTATGEVFEVCHYGLTRTVADDGWLSAYALFGGDIVEIDDTTYASALVGADFGGDEGTFNPTGGITTIGSRYYVLGYDSARSNRWFVKVLDATFTQVDEWEYTAESSGSPKKPGIGTDGTSVLIGRSNRYLEDDRIVIRTYPVTGGASTATTVADSPVRFDVNGVSKGTFDLGATRFVVTVPTAHYVYDTAGVEDFTEAFTRAAGATARGLYWDGTRFWGIDDTTRLHEYEATPASSPVVEYSWFDSDAAGDGQHETARGPSRTINQARRARLHVETDPPNDNGGTDDPDSVRIWIDGERQPDLTPGVTTASYADWSTGITTKAADFPTTGADPGMIESSDGLSFLTGAGGGSWDLDKIRTSEKVGLVAASGTFVCNLYAQRVGNVVIITGYAQRPSGSSSSFVKVTQLPLGYRPIDGMLMPAHTAWGGSIIFQYDIDEVSGDIDVRMSGSNGFGMGLNAAFVTDDPWPS